MAPPQRTPDSQQTPEHGWAPSPPDVRPLGAPVLGAPPGRVLVVLAHPDDAEFTCGGLVARLVDEGAQVVLYVATSGQLGRDADAWPDAGAFGALRRAEAREGAGRLGASAVFGGFPDGGLGANHAGLVEQVCAQVRRHTPDVVVTADPYTRLYRQHPDHRAVGAATLEAVFPAASMNSYFPDQLADGVGVWEVPQMLLVFSDRVDVVVELDEALVGRKVAALQAHHSQSGSHGPDVSQASAVREAASAFTQVRFGEAFAHVGVTAR